MVVLWNEAGHNQNAMWRQVRRMMGPWNIQVQMARRQLGTEDWTQQRNVGWRYRFGSARSLGFQSPVHNQYYPTWFLITSSHHHHPAWFPQNGYSKWHTLHIEPHLQDLMWMTAFLGPQDWKTQKPKETPLQLGSFIGPRLKEDLNKVF